MFDKAAFEIIGRVGQIKQGNGVVRVSIAANASFKKNGEWQDRTIWNEVSVFEETSRSYVTTRFVKGDLVRCAGTIRQNSYEKDGERRYVTDLVVEEISRAPLKKADGAADEPAGEDAPAAEPAANGRGKGRGRKSA
jgi:single stranded DNA-binding protein